MAVDEQVWRRAVQALANVVGEQEADALVARFLDEPARRDHLQVMEERLGARIDSLERVFDVRFDGVNARFDGVNARFDGVNARFDGVNGRIDSLEDSVKERFAGVNGRIDSLERGIEGRIDSLKAVLEEKIEHSKQEVIAVVRGELNSQLRSLLFGFVGLQAAIGAFVIGVLRFASP